MWSLHYLESWFGICIVCVMVVTRDFLKIFLYTIPILLLSKTPWIISCNLNKQDFWEFGEEERGHHEFIHISWQHFFSLTDILGLVNCFQNNYSFRVTQTSLAGTTLNWKPVYCSACTTCALFTTLENLVQEFTLSIGCSINDWDWNWFPYYI